MENKKNQGFIMQAGILAAAGFITRIIGTLYRTPLTAIIGNEGNGYYGAAYYIYLIILTVASYSMPTAISKIISQKLALKQYRNAQRVLKGALIYVTVMGLAASFILFFGADFFLAKNSATVLRVFAPTVIIYGYLGVLRGYFQAHRTMVQTSISQILEQIVNAFVSIFAAIFLINCIKDGDETVKAVQGACGSALGTGSGVLVGLLFMIIVYGLNKKIIRKRVLRDKTEDIDSYKTVFKGLLLIVTPIIISSCIYNMNTVVNQTVFVQILMKMKEFTESEASKLYGVYSGRSVVIANIPVALGAAMSSAMIPTVSTLFEQGKLDDLKKKIGDGVRATMLLSIPAAVGLCILADPMMALLQGNAEYYSLAVNLLRGLSITVVFYQVSTISNGVLQGIGKVNIPVINAAIALVLQTIVVVILMMYTDLMDYSLVIATLVYTFTVTLLNELSVRKYLGYRQEILTTFLSPFACSILMGIFTYLTYEGLHTYLSVHYTIAMTVSIFVSIIVYFVAIIKLNRIDEEDLMKLPKGRFLAKVAKKVHLI